MSRLHKKNICRDNWSHVYDERYKYRKYIYLPLTATKRNILKVPGKIVRCVIDSRQQYVIMTIE